MQMVEILLNPPFQLSYDTFWMLSSERRWTIPHQSRRHPIQNESWALAPTSATVETSKQIQNDLQSNDRNIIRHMPVMLPSSIKQTIKTCDASHAAIKNKANNRNFNASHAAIKLNHYEFQLKLSQKKYRPWDSTKIECLSQYMIGPLRNGHATIQLKTNRKLQLTILRQQLSWAQSCMLSFELHWATPQQIRNHQSQNQSCASAEACARCPRHFLSATDCGQAIQV